MNGRGVVAIGDGADATTSGAPGDSTWLLQVRTYGHANVMLRSRTSWPDESREIDREWSPLFSENCGIQSS